jgi:uncharacterized membrane protein YecN with MAPEG domain
MITPIYAALLAFIFVFLSISTIRLRRELKIALGDGNNPRLLKIIRAHSNFAEYVPFALILIYMAESQDAPKLLIHLLGISLLAGRSIHAYGINQLNENYKFRVFGMSMTFITIITSSLYLIFSYLVK